MNIVPGIVFKWESKYWIIMYIDPVPQYVYCCSEKFEHKDFPLEFFNIMEDK